MLIISQYGRDRTVKNIAIFGASGHTGKYIIRKFQQYPDESYTETMLAALRGFTCCIPQSKEGGYVIAPGTGNAGDGKATKAMEQAYSLGKNL